MRRPVGPHLSRLFTLSVQVVEGHLLPAGVVFVNELDAEISGVLRLVTSTPLSAASPVTLNPSRLPTFISAALVLH